jgi:aspartyl aminopeptidase
MTFFDASPDPFHAVQTCIHTLQSSGFIPLDMERPLRGQLTRGGKYYFTKNQSTLVAFAVGGEFVPGQGGGFKIIGGHTDSPNLKIKPRSKRSGMASSTGCVQIAVECYGGGLWHTWLDRDLGVSGRVFVRTKVGEQEEIVSRLVKLDRAVVRIPSLAIHLQTAKEREALEINKEDHLVPILSMAVENALTKGTTTTTSSPSGEEDTHPDGWTEHQEPILLEMLARELQINVQDIVDFELNLFDVQKASLGGAFSEFVHSARLDNLASCFMAVEALVQYTSTSSEDQQTQEEKSLLQSDKDISLVALFDHEEVGSESTTGAGSPIIQEAVSRICEALLSEQDPSTSTSTSTSTTTPSDAKAMTLAKSFVLSVDQAHAIHPNYSSKHEKGHAPKMNHGMVIKRNSNQRYATNAITGLIIREIARKAGMKPIQEFVVRNDCGCGTTIGPIISSTTGIRAIDLGCPQWSMHSIRETMGTCDFRHGLDLFCAFFKYFRQVDDGIPRH